MATRSSILAWKILWTEEPDQLLIMSLKKSQIWLSECTCTSHTHMHTHTHTHARTHKIQAHAVNRAPYAIAPSIQWQNPLPPEHLPGKLFWDAHLRECQLYYLCFLNSGVWGLADWRETAPLAGPGSSQRQCLDSASPRRLTEPGPTGRPPTLRGSLLSSAPGQPLHSEPMETSTRASPKSAFPFQGSHSPGCRHVLAPSAPGPALDSSRWPCMAQLVPPLQTCKEQTMPSMPVCWFPHAWITIKPTF